MNLNPLLDLDEKSCCTERYVKFTCTWKIIVFKQVLLL